MFHDKLKSIKLTFEKQVSEINKNITKEPLESTVVLQMLNARYRLNIKDDDFRMESSIDTIGEHFAQATFYSEKFDKDFSFYFKILLKERTAPAM